MKRIAFWIAAAPAAAGFIVCFGAIVTLAAWAHLVERAFAGSRTCRP